MTSFSDDLFVEREVLGKLTNDPLFLDVWISGLKGVRLRLGLSLDGEVETASVEPGHLLVFLTY